MYRSRNTGRDGLTTGARDFTIKAQPLKVLSIHLKLRIYRNKNVNFIRILG